jgi:DNA-binding NtrC family response regulator
VHTAEDSGDLDGADDVPVPGVLIVWSAEAPVSRAFRIPRAGLVLGRDLLGDDDDRISRQHARVRAADGAFVVTDLGSRNGSFLDGEPLQDREATGAPGAVLRAGRTSALLVDDIRPHEAAPVAVQQDAVVGPALADVWRAAERAARTGGTLLITGESGAGKELVARAFHAASGARGAMVAVNAAAIPASVAERLLFGTRRGAFSGADRDAEGYIAAARNGTLFLDEIADLGLEVQGKLLRVLETGELLPLGASRPEPVQVKLVAATLRDLREEVAARRFREDLYYRIGRPEVVVPALRERREEIPHLVAREATQAGVRAHPTLIEACLLRPWPGNVRELIGDVRRAARAAQEEGRAQVRATDLDPRAGLPIASAAGDDETAPKVRALPDLPAVADALRGAAGNVSAAARALGIHRNQLRRLLAKHPELAALAARDQLRPE